MSQDLLRPLADPDSFPFAVASAALIGAGTLIDPNRVSVGGRLALRFGTAAFTGVSVLLELRKTPLFSPASTVGLVTATVGTVLAMSEATEALDARMQQALVRSGARRPRLILAAGAAALSLAVYALDRVTARRSGAEDLLEGEPTVRPLPPEVRSLLEGMLDLTDGHGASVLRAQLDTAQEQVWSDAGLALTGMVEFTVDEALPRVVPHDFTFPVKARFTSPSGIPLEASLRTSGGRLATLVVDGDLTDPGFDGYEDRDPLEGLTVWPRRADVQYVMDAAD